MKFKFLMIFSAVASLLLASCEYDNFDAPESTFSGRVVYNEQPIAIRNNGPELQLWQDGYPLKEVIRVYIDHNGNFSAKLFDGAYKMTRRADAPWLQQPTDTIRFNVKGSTAMDVPVTPYFTVTGESFQKSGNNITAKFVVNKVVQTANLDAVQLFLGSSILTDQGRNELPNPVSANLGNLVLGQQTELVGALPDRLKNLDFIYARVGVKSTSAGEYIYTPVQKIALK